MQEYSVGVQESAKQSPRRILISCGDAEKQRREGGREKCQVYLNIRRCHTQGSDDNFITSTYKNDCRVMQMAFASSHSPAFCMHTAAEEALRQSPEADKLLSNLIRSLFKASSSPPAHLALQSPVTQLFRYFVCFYACVWGAGEGAASGLTFLSIKAERKEERNRGSCLPIYLKNSNEC